RSRRDSRERMETIETGGEQLLPSSTRPISPHDPGLWPGSCHFRCQGACLRVNPSSPPWYPQACRRAPRGASCMPACMKCLSWDGDILDLCESKGNSYLDISRDRRGARLREVRGALAFTSSGLGNRARGAGDFGKELGRGCEDLEAVGSRIRR